MRTRCPWQRSGETTSEVSPCSTSSFKRLIFKCFNFSDQMSAGSQSIRKPVEMSNVCPFFSCQCAWLRAETRIRLIIHLLPPPLLFTDLGCEQTRKCQSTSSSEHGNEYTTGPSLPPKHFWALFSLDRPAFWPETWVHLLQLYSTGRKSCNLQQAAKKKKPPQKNHSASHSVPKHTGMYGVQKTVFIMQRW